MTTSHRILVADDNEDAADTLAMVLRAWGHAVHVVHDGQAAVKAFEQFNPSVCILDFNMPRLNGWEAARQIRANGVLHTILIAMSGTQKPEDVPVYGFDHFLPKPADVDALAALLGELAT